MNRLFTPTNSDSADASTQTVYSRTDSVRLYEKSQHGATIHGVTVHRVASTRFGRTALIGRGFDYPSFYRSAWQCLCEIAHAGDTVIAKTDPPLLSLAVAPIARRRRARLVNWLQDIYPETAAVLGVPLIRGPVAGALTAVRNRSLRNAQANVAVGELMADRIKALGVPPARIHVIPNWCDDEAIRPLQPANNPLRDAWHLAGKFVVGYSGNLGRAHEFETMLAAANGLRNEPHIVFLMIGGGKQFEAMARAIKAHGLEDAFRFRSYQERHAAALVDRFRCALAVT